jgi:hypothetical protein
VLDQTRTVGLVTLPGAYVGMLLGGASPAQAGLAQLTVLLALIAAEMISAWVVAELVARGLIRRQRRSGTPPQWTRRARKRSTRSSSDDRERPVNSSMRCIL